MDDTSVAAGLPVCLVNPAIATSETALNLELLLPLGIAYLAGNLRQGGHRVAVVDALGEGAECFHPLDDYPRGLLHGLSDDETAARIPADTRLIGVSCMFSVNWVVNRRLVQTIRRRFPDAVIVIGGEHATAMPEYCLRDAPEIDAVVLGEGEVTLNAVADAVARGMPLASVPGLAFLDGADYRLSEGRPRERALDRLAWPAWDMLAMDLYMRSETAENMGRPRTMSVIASRGCPYACTFCTSPGMWGRLWRAREPGDVVAEIEHDVATYQVKELDFFDLTMITKRRWIVDFCRLMIDRKVKVSWEVHCTRSEAIDGEVTRLLKQAGCTHVTYAAESGSDRVLQAIDKKVNRRAMMRSIGQARAAGLRTKISFVLGFPDDRLRDVLASYLMAARAAIRGSQDASFFPFAPYPGSSLFRRLVAEGKIHVDDAYFFGLANYNLKQVRSYCPAFSDRQLSRLCVIGILWFYAVSLATHPRRVLTSIREYLRPGDRAELRLTAALVYLKNRRAYLKKMLTPAQ